MTAPAQTRIQRILNPFLLPGLWLKGGLHLHTSASDGTLTPAEALRRYRALGYDFLAISDHESVTVPDEIPPGLTWLPAVEYATRAADPPNQQFHILSVGTRKCLAARGYPVKNILKLLAEVSPFTVVCHPYWSNEGGDDLLKLPPFSAVEVYNHGAERSLGRGHAEFFWDYMLSAGRRVWGLAGDDTHGPDDLGGTSIRLRAPDSSPASILAALIAGSFYSTAGPEFLAISVDAQRVSVRTSPVSSIAFLADRQRGAFFPAPPGSTLSEASYAFKGAESYLRIQLTDPDGNSAWSNPVSFWDTLPAQSEKT